ncbi:caspase family protein [Aquicoccus sp. G2-2]|uniref:caspase family protein n=1 Tax=Aquicoccus sp. G2-2 TaxID=3092120 RepID=UPI002ADF4221|nr:caspase family protein [Aquicoccus sp. G2-2]MEA1114694.1 caspase family protein [Aquicoccus sp. G2-2]
MSLVLFAALAVPVAAAEKVALLIGNGDYRSVPELKNTINDATDLSDTLKGIGFDTTLLINATGAELRATLEKFAFKAETADLALIYFAGHGVEVQGENFLIPVDASVKSNQDVVQQAVSLRDFLHAADKARTMRIVILDSCRNNPFGDLVDIAQASDGATGGRSTRGVGGLAPPSPDRGTLVAFAARDGNVALDGEGDNSPFAMALMDKMKQPGLEISLMFRAVRDEVLKSTSNRQEPHTYGSLSGIPFYLASLKNPAAGGSVQGLQGRIDAWSKVQPDLEKQYQVLAEDDDTRALYALAMMHLHPDSPRYDPEKARGYLERASTLGSAESLYELGRLYETGIGAPKDDAKALSYYQKAARLDYGAALNDMGIFQLEGMLGLAPDLDRALQYFRRAAEQHSPQAMFNYATMIDDHRVPGKTAADAASYFYQALRAGNPDVYAALLRHHSTLEPATRKALQKKLKENAFYAGPVDGDFGPGTQRGLRAAYGLTGG